MGCVESKIDKEERVRNCKERKRLMKHLVGFRREFAEAQLAYLRALKNTGVTLRQFTESETLELEDTNFGVALPPSPPPPLPPSPPPPPPPNFSPDLRKTYDDKQGSPPPSVVQEDVIEIDDDDDDTHTPPPPPVARSDWEYWDLFASPYPQCGERRETVVEEENWEETNTEFLEEDEDNKDVVVVDDSVVEMDHEKQQTVELVDDNISMASWFDKGTSDMAIVVSRSSKTLAGIFRDLDDYFLKASAGAKDVAVLIDINTGDSFLYQSIKKEKSKRHNSAKALSALSWSWSFKSINSTRDAGDFLGPSEPCKPGSHCVTLEKIYIEEQKLYKEVKEEESTKAELEKRSLLLQKQEEIHDLAKTEKTRLSVESLQSDISLLQQSISKSRSTIVKLIDEELHPQLVAIASGLRHMWETMCECHKVQNHLSQRLNHLTSQQTIDCTTEYRRQAASQLKTEVTSWYNSLCRVINSQHGYVKTLCRWIQLTNCHRDGDQQSHLSSVVHSLSEEWLRALEKLPDKMASEAIKNFLSVIHSIVSHQEEELSLQKRATKLERKLQCELDSLAELEMKFDANTILSSKHPLSIKRAKIEVLKKRANDEKAKYMSSVHTTQVMFLNNLQTSLPNLFQALMEFSSTYSQSFDAVLNCATPLEHENGS